jgi:archaetidylinositol phosphate synthase
MAHCLRNHKAMHHRKFQEALRVHKSILADAEKRLLIRIANKIPNWVNSDHLTILGLIGMAFAGISYWLSSFNKYWLILAVISLFVNWFGDSLDGTVARVRNKLRPRYGFYVDHIVDAFGIIFLLGGLIFSNYISFAIGSGLLITYFLMSIEIYLATYTIGKFQISFWKWGPTELRILLAIGTLTLLHHTHVTIAGSKFLLFDVGGVCAIIGILTVIIISTVRNTAKLYKEETVDP